jgi:hypothetical protein
MNSISRRELLVLTAGAAAIATLPRSLVQADPLGLPIGVQLYSVAAELRKLAIALSNMPLFPPV